jgi:hypothetical protein
MFNLPYTALSDITGNATALFHDFWIIVALMTGAPLGFWIIRKVIEIVSGESIVSDSADEDQTDYN